ncbi:hypothetical protein Glove_24g64 [Diversispora epigaea]|uniref:TLDc domain-containing protein n=1 Tax=Diversispora epigaea TaxID=1348612 RepID=A0A397JIR2_9GLOM|nr:hypothetical protein Glove_24g64 [Diversispora epigaea]
MIVANEFEIDELTKKLENHLIETKSSWLKSHFSLVYHSIFSENNFKDLEKFYNDIVAKYPNLIFDAEDFNSLQESAQVSLLKRDDLQLEEVVIWEYIIKWGIAQNSTLPLLFNNFHISNEDFWSKVEPYKKIFDKQLWKDLIQHLIIPEKPVKSKILPPRSVLIQELPTRSTEQAKPLSTIISCEHVAEISSWIDHKSITYSLTDIPYEFRLILRGSINGFAPQTFWDICHGHASTVVIMKVKGTEEIFGGYNPLIWDANTYVRWKKTDDSFIFSLKNGNVQNSILSRVKDRDYAILNIDKTNSCGCNNSAAVYYEKPIGTTTKRFSIVDYEVFKIIKKADEILGGYIWDANAKSDYTGSWAKTSNSFIFSLKNGNIHNTILSRVKICDNAILNFEKHRKVYYDPYFGYNLRMYRPSSNFILEMKSRCNNYFIIL